ncbi:MAG: Uma2 family endonuclease [Fimbriimonadales bacterium]|nr:Uma2 family endonuclease [Fimbriimonadales bacterium]
MAVVREQPKRKRRYTEQDLLQMPDDGRKYELVNGRIQVVPTGARHGEIVSGLIARLHNAKRPATVVYSEAVGFRMRGGNVRSPDASVMRRERLPQGESPNEFIDGAPDLAVEVVSPSENLHDLYQKVGEYFESGAREVWLLFPERKQVYRFTAPLEIEVLHENDTLTGGELLPDFQVRVRELFE